ncbi:hypothetical protein [Mesorhizobium sp. M1163]|uniref:hypothetical protein n=1 Tax=Mesorhizobium sp. M1163 TaxID=2957065 RepID=UPI003335A09C
MNPLSFVDSPFSGAGFLPVDMRAVFGSEAYLRRCVEVEVALALARAGLGIIS